MSSCSFANASMLPENDTQPTTNAKTMGMPFSTGTPKGRSWRYSASDMTAAAAPPTPLKMATICGMAVIGTLRAVGTATSAPSPIADADDPVVAGRLDEEGEQYGHDHPGHADEVAVASRARRAQAP